MQDERHLSIKAQLENIPLACDFVVEAAETATLDERAVYHCQLAVDEACTNIIEHGFSKSAALGKIDILTGIEDSSFIIVITDNSPAFNPLGHEDPDPTEDLESREPGGWGIYFIKKLMDSVDYRYVDGNNQLTLRKFRQITGESKRLAADELEISSQPVAKHYIQVDIRGRMDSQTSDEVETKLKTMIEQKHSRLIVNLAGVEYVSSSGLKVLVSAWRMARQHGGDVLLASLQPRIREVFEMIGFDMMFNIYASPAEAIADDPLGT